MAYWARFGEKSGSNSAKCCAPAILGATPERLAHGRIERLARPIADKHGAIAPESGDRYSRRIGAARAITAGMRDAGEEFRRWFQVAHLDPLRAADLMRSRIGVRRIDTGAPIEHARARVWHAVTAVGGLASPAYACLWHVVGLETSIKEWALEQGWPGRSMPREAATGVLISALGMLKCHWRGAAV